MSNSVLSKMSSDNSDNEVSNYEVSGNEETCKEKEPCFRKDDKVYDNEVSDDKLSDNEVSNKEPDKNKTNDNISQDVHNSSCEPIKILDGSDIYLPNKYILWCHETNTKNWEEKSYKKISIIKTVSDFWTIFNNFDKLDTETMHYFLMKNNIVPTWEYPDNRKGGTCSFRINIMNSLDMWEDFCSKMVIDKLIDDINDINGISYNPKNNWAMIKIWNRDNNKDISKTLPDSILNKYRNISIKFRINKPEF